MTDTDKKFDPATSSFEMQLATASMQNAIIEEQNSTAQSLLQSTNAEQAAGMAEIVTLMDIYNGKCTGPNGDYVLTYDVFFTKNYDASGNTIWAMNYAQTNVSAPGFNNTSDDQKTTAAANLAQQFSQLQTSGYDAFNEMSSSMLSQDTSNSSSIAQFAKDSSSGLGFIANLMASSLA